MKQTIILWVVVFLVLLSGLLIPTFVHLENKPQPIEPIITTEAIAPVEPTITPTETILPTEPPEPIITYTIYFIPKEYNSEDTKSFEDYTDITDHTSKQYKLLNGKNAYTGSDGVRMVNGRYCIALGSYFTDTIGQYVDVILQNGTVIECILGDQKSDRHTDAAHIAHRSDGSIVEFIIDSKATDFGVRLTGNISNLHESWKSPVVKIVVYDINAFDA